MLFATTLVPGTASGPVIFSDTPLSFMMGVNTATGVVADTHHPLRGVALANSILAIPFGRGSCAGSGAILELLVSGTAPAALIFNQMEDILTLGVLIGKALFEKSIPVILLEDAEAFGSLARATSVHVTGEELLVKGDGESRISLSPPRTDAVQLDPSDMAILNGDRGPAARVAMEMIVSYAALQGAKSLLNVSQAHIDACCYVGKSSLLVPERLLELGGKFVVPSTCNAVNVDRLRWRELGAGPELSEASKRVGDIYLAMGAKMSFTCAPYLLDSKPKQGEQIGWAESNAVVFANSVLGARTQKYPDYLEVFIGLTGRAPNSGCHLSEGRKPLVRVMVPKLDNPDASIFPLLGYHIGVTIGCGIPLICGMNDIRASLSHLKAFSAGFAASSACPMFHIKGVTPEAGLFTEIEDYLDEFVVTIGDLGQTWQRLNSAKDNSVDLVSLGNPHFGIEEFSQLVALCRGKRRNPKVEMIITTSQDAYKKALDLGYLDTVEKFGARVITDTCWCMVEEPVIPPHTRNIMTNSSKYAHYGPGLVSKGFHFGSLAACVDAACDGERRQVASLPTWLL